MESYSNFLEKAQNLDILDRKTQKILLKSKFTSDFSIKNKNKTSENNMPPQSKPKSNDIRGYFKPAGGKEKNIEETPIFVIYLLEL